MSNSSCTEKLLTFLFLQVLGRLIKGLKTIEKSLPFSRDPRLGWLTFCPTNLGTTIRASVHIRLPKLAAKPDFKKICDGLKLQVYNFPREIFCYCLP